ncbi:MAG: hypothetical protein AB7G51_11930 [Steroidobacteraceae bacterium]
MTRATREDMIVIHMGIDTLLECVRHTEAWWRSRGDAAALRRTQQLGHAILTTRRKFFARTDDGDAQIAEALIVAEGLRDAARQCQEGQAALHARLNGGAEAIERLCRSREVQP